MKAPASTRVWYAFMAAITWIGIYLTGFSIVNGLLYMPAIAFTIAGIIGFCPSQVAISKLFGAKRKRF